MTATSARILLWGPRVLGILVCVFLSLFALDVFSERKPFVQAFADFVIHLAPAAMLLAVVVASWRWEWVGGVAFIGLGVVYATLITNRLDWILTISEPLMIVGAFFLWSWRHHAEPHAPR